MPPQNAPSEEHSVKVSVVATVLNEGPAIQRLLESLAAQSRRPDEVVIVDGGSSDTTLLILGESAASGPLPVRVLEQPGANISEGRNTAISAATGDLIAATDAGVRLERQWLEKLVAPCEAGGMGPPGAGVAGWFVADPQTLFEVVMGATVLPHVREVKPGSFLPSSRSVAFLKTAWQAVGGYPEWLDYCEDLVFDLRLRQRYGPFQFAPEATVHFRPRGSLPAFFKQYYRYARGDGKANLWRRRHAIRYVSYLVALPGLVALALLHSPAWWLALVVGAAAYTATPYRRLWPMLTAPALHGTGGKRTRRFGLLDRLAALALVPVIRVVGDVAKMLGYPPGVAWRWRNRHRPEVHWR